MYNFGFLAAAHQDAETTVTVPTTVTAPVSTTVDLTGVKLQGSYWFNQDYNAEDYWLNVLHFKGNNYPETRTSDRTHTSLVNMGLINPANNFPRGRPATGSPTFYFGEYFINPSGAGIAGHVHRTGVYYLDWVGDCSVIVAPAPNGEHVILSTASAGNDYHGRIQINKFDTSANQVNLTPRITPRTATASLVSIAMYHEDDVSAYNAGKLLTPHARDLLKRYHIFRTMDVRSAMANIATSIGNHVRGDMKTSFGLNNWKGHAFPPYPNHAQYTAQSQRQGTPNNIMLRLAVEASIELWDNLPICFDSPFTFQSSSYLERQLPQDRAAWNIAQDLTSIGWQSIADGRKYEAFMHDYVSAVIAEGYPVDRNLYLTVGNEVWNTAPAFVFTTQWCAGLGRGYSNANGNLDNFNGAYSRIGYGVQMAKMMLAAEDAFADAGRSNQQRIYVVESQMANPTWTLKSCEAMKHYVSTYRGLDWDDYKNRVRWSAATYWGAGSTLYYVMPSILDQYGGVYWDNGSQIHQDMRDKYEQRYSENASAVYASIIDFVMNTPYEGGKYGTFSWITHLWDQHIDRGNTFGVEPLNGGYEGGASFETHRFIREEYGASNANMLKMIYDINAGSVGYIINQAIHDGLINRYATSGRGFIVTNYVIGGRAYANSQPWFDGIYPETAYWASAGERVSTMIQNSWNKYMKPATSV